MKPQKTQQFARFFLKNNKQKQQENGGDKLDVQKLTIHVSS